MPLLAVAAAGRGQNPPDLWCSPTECPPPELPRPQQHLVNLGINAVLGSLATVVQQTVRRELEWQDVLAGGAGGAVGYAGKVVAAEPFFGAGFLGRQVAAMGGSMAVNASLGDGLLERLVFPVGPVRLYIRPGAPTNAVDVRLDLMAVGTATVWMVREGARLDPARSMSAGMLVFQGYSPLWRSGLHFAGVVLLPDEDPGYERTDRLLFAHERVHALQSDQVFLALGEPVERWALEERGQQAGFAEWIDLNVTASLFPLVRHLGYEPWEGEARFLVEPLEWWH